IGADGVHLGQQDLSLARARALLGPEFSIGISTHTREQALAAQAGGASLIGFGPVFATRTKQDAEAVVRIVSLREGCLAVSLPVVAIGGIPEQNVAEVAGSGARMAAAIGAICSASDPGTATRTFQSAFRTEAVTSR